MSDPRLDAALRRHYDENRLDEEGVQRILLAGESVSRRRWRSAWLTGVAAVLLLGLGGWLWQHQQTDLRTSVLAEIALNHHKDMPADILASRFVDIERSMDRADFRLAPDTPIAGAQLTGARYCSIQGQLAVLLKLTVDGRRHTLYVTPVTDELANLAPYSAQHDGVDVRLWTDAGRLFALADEAASGVEP